MPLETPFTPLPLRTVSSANLAILKTVTQRPAGARMGWVASNYPGTSPITSFGGTSENELRPPATIAFGLAALVATGSNNSSVSGYTDEQITATAIRLISSFANTHAGNGGNWGGVAVAAGAVITPDSGTYHWQGAMWVALVGVAAKLLWPSLSGAQQTAVTNMVQLEADRFINYTVPYWYSRYGTVVTAGDTKAEENAWNAWVLMLAAGWWNTHARAAQWLAKGLELIYSAGATPLMPTSKRPHNGLTGWGLKAGFNIALNGTATNHLVDPHPNYMASLTTSAWMAGLTFGWLRGMVPAVTQAHGLCRVYRAMMDLPFTGYASAGTIYDTAGQTSAVNYPSGTDGFNVLQQQTYMAMDAMAHITGCDTLGSVPAATWLGIHAAAQNSLQVSDPATWNSQWDLHNGAWSLLCDWIVRNSTVVVSNASAADLLG